MSKKSPLAAAPTGDSLTADEQKFFDSAGEEGGTTAPEPSEIVSRETKPEKVKAAPVVETEEVETPEVEEGAAPAQPNKPQKMVPHQALHESREQTKAEKAERQKLAEQYQRLEERTNLLLQNFTQQTAPKDDAAKSQAAPDPENDPLGYLLWGMKSLDERQKQFEQQQVQGRELNEQGRVLQQLQNTALAQEQEFKAETPDYDEASQFLQKNRIAELTQMGYTPAESREQLRIEAISIAARTQQQGKNPAQVIYEMAKLRGFKPAEAEQTSAPEAAELEANTGKLKAVAAGQRQTASLSMAGGAAPKAMTAQRLMEMGPEEFEAFRKKSPGDFRNLMGA